MRTIDQIASEICTLAGRLNAANYQLLILIAEFDKRKGWSDSMTQSCAHWLNWKCGIAMGAAREKVRVARALETLPKISAAMKSGHISYSKVREVTRVASPEHEDYLLMICENGTASHVERLVQTFRRCKEAEELSRDKRQQESRAVTFRYDEDGSLVLKCRLPAEAGAKVMKALDLAVEEIRKEEPKDIPAGTLQPPVRYSARRADALAVIAESFLAHGVLEVRGTDANQIVVHVSEETLRTKKAGCCEIEDGPSIAAETARRFGCDASVLVMIENDDGEPLNVGRKTRTISAPLRRVLNARDKCCRFPGCSNKRWLDAHHIDHWAGGGETKPSNLVLLCGFHHRAVHEGGIRIERLDDGALRFVKPNGQSVDSVAPGYTQPPGDPQDVPAGAFKDCWHGEKMDLDLAVGAMFQQERRAHDVPAGAS